MSEINEIIERKIASELINDKVFLNKMTNLAKKKFEDALEKVDVKKLSDGFTTVFEGVTEDYEFCSLGEIFDEKIREALENIDLSVVFAKKEQKTKK